MISKMVALDWRAMKYNWSGVLLIPLMSLLASLFSPLFVIPITIFWFQGFSQSTFSAEEKGELNYLYLAMPIRRVDVVRGRFALSFVLMLVGLAVGTAMLSVVNFLSNIGIVFFGRAVLYFSQYIALFAIGFLIYAFASLFSFPFLFKFGYEKGKYYGTYIPIIFVFALLIVHDVIMWQFSLQTSVINLVMGFISGNLFIMAGGFFILSIALLLLSYLLSVRIYNKRDF